MTAHRISFTVNGGAEVLDVRTDQTLVDVLRGELLLTGTKEACAIGVCGVCSVLVDGQLVSACLFPAVSLDGTTVETVEGLATADGQLTPLQEAFIRCGAFQCGICTPGQLMAARALLREHARPDEAEARDWMMGNLCRCTGYEGILDAILSSAGGEGP